MPTVLITGASRGYGRELLHVFASKKWVTFALVRNISIAAELESLYGSDCHAIVGDVALDSVQDKIVEVLGKYTNSLDLLINNAGNIRKNRGIDKADAVELMDHFNVHCIGSLRCIKAALPFLKESPAPVVVNITSRWGSISRTVSGTTGLIYSYQIAKCAQNMLTACLFYELKAFNIKVLAVHPGRLKTSVGAPDADVDPREAAEKLYDWLARIDNDMECKCYDVTNNATIDW